MKYSPKLVAQYGIKYCNAQDSDAVAAKITLKLKASFFFNKYANFATFALR
jgi:hypothetical protein